MQRFGILAVVLLLSTACGGSEGAAPEATASSTTTTASTTTTTTTVAPATTTTTTTTTTEAPRSPMPAVDAGLATAWLSDQLGPADLDGFGRAWPWCPILETGQIETLGGTDRDYVIEQWPLVTTDADGPFLQCAWTDAAGGSLAVFLFVPPAGYEGGDEANLVMSDDNWLYEGDRVAVFCDGAACSAAWQGAGMAVQVYDDSGDPDHAAAVLAEVVPTAIDRPPPSFNAAGAVERLGALSDVIFGFVPDGEAEFADCPYGDPDAVDAMLVANGYVSDQVEVDAGFSRSPFPGDTVGTDTVWCQWFGTDLSLGVSVFARDDLSGIQPQAGIAVSGPFADGTIWNGCVDGDCFWTWSDDELHMLIVMQGFEDDRPIVEWLIEDTKRSLTS